MEKEYSPDAAINASAAATIPTVTISSTLAHGLLKSDTGARSNPRLQAEEVPYLAHLESVDQSGHRLRLETDKNRIQCEHPRWCGDHHIQESIEMARRLAREEGLFVGISSGCNAAAAIKVARKYPKEELIATILCDHGFRYFSCELCGVEASVEVPERDHPLDDHTTRMLERYQGKWEVIRYG